MAERINVRPEKGISLLGNQADARFSAFEKQADQADCGEARFIVELLRETYAMKPRKMYCSLCRVQSSNRPDAFLRPSPKRPSAY